MHLIKYLNETFPDAHVYNIDIVDPHQTARHNVNPPLRADQPVSYIFVNHDIREPLDIPGIETTEADIIFNLAAIHRTPGHPDEAYFDTNIRGAINVCEFARKNNINRIVFTSSIDVYGAGEEAKLETSIPQPNKAYGKSKLQAETIHAQWQAEDAAKRRLIVLRPGVVFGKGENGNFTRLYKSLKNFRFIYPGRKDTIKACIYVEELVRVMVHFLNVDAVEQLLFNCCYYPPATIEEIVGVIKKETGLRRIVPKISNRILMPLATVAKWLGSPFGICPERVKKLCVSTNINGEKLAQSGYEFRYPFNRAVAHWYDQNDRKTLI